MYLETHFHRLRRKFGPMVWVLLLISFLAVFYEKNRQGFLNVDQYDSIKYYWKSWVGWSYCSLTSATLWSVKWYMSQWWLVIQSCKLFSVILIYLTCKIWCFRCTQQDYFFCCISLIDAITYQQRRGFKTKRSGATGVSGISQKSIGVIEPMKVPASSLTATVCVLQALLCSWDDKLLVIK